MQKVKNNPIPTVLVILDGFGLADKRTPGNAITPVTAPNIFRYIKDYASSTLCTSGESVGLFPGQEGNSEAGHLNIGAGRIVKQDLMIISDAIHDGTFFKNYAFKEALYHVKKYDTAVHVMCLLTGGNSAHTYPELLYAMLEFFRWENHSKVFIHLFTDGRDSGPHFAPKFLHELRGHMLSKEKIATVTGRYYAMDRNKVWSRTEAFYNAMVSGVGHKAESAEDALAQAYTRNENDEHVSPTVIMEKGKSVATMKDNDVIFFVNARSDRARQITKAFVQRDFEKENLGSFKRKSVPKNIRFVAMTDFGPDLPGVFTAFPSPDIVNCLPKVISDNYRQLYISETEKYAHVTYFINGGFADPLNGEKREVVKSAAEYSYANLPEMNSCLLTKKVVDYLNKGKYNFICVNFPNADMVGHTGDLAATKKAVHAVDVSVKKITDAALKLKGQVLVIADHGNAEVMLNPELVEVMTEHTTNPVPCIWIKAGSKKIKLKNGILADVAPTLLKMMKIDQPKEMTGKALF